MKKTRLNPVICGFVIGIWAAVSEALFGPTLALDYAIAMGADPRDPLHWILNHTLGTDLPISPISMEIPVLTVVGIVSGAVVAARLGGELKLRAAQDPVGAFMIGLIVAIFVLLLGACPIKGTVLVAYGDLLLLIGLISIIAGSIMACEYLKWVTKKRSQSY